MARIDPVLPRTRRLFLALWPDDAVRSQIAEHARHWTFPQTGKLYGRADWHVTLHFLGNVPAERVSEIADGVDVPIDPFELVLDRPQVWPRGLAVLGASGVPQLLVELHDRLGRALRSVNLSVDARPYQPHLTLARHAKGAVPPTASAPVVWPVRALALVISTGKAGARYQVLRRYG